ncbi:hypothetical protein [Zhenpiania hominis]
MPQIIPIKKLKNTAAFRTMPFHHRTDFHYEKWIWGYGIDEHGSV